MNGYSRAIIKATAELIDIFYEDGSDVAVDALISKAESITKRFGYDYDEVVDDLSDAVELAV